MASVKKGTVKPTAEWARHLRRWGKRQFWKAERKAVKKETGNVRFG